MQTIRQEMMELLFQREHAAIDLSQLLRIREKDVYEHLDHIRRSMGSQGKKLTVTPARCLECYYTFETRRRLSKPGRCPRCRGEHIEDPKYRVVSLNTAAQASLEKPSTT